MRNVLIQVNINAEVHMLELASLIPNFKLEGITKEGKEKIFSNDDFLNKLLVIYFYPKDNTSGCTKESCAFDFMLKNLSNKVNIVGISADTIESHKKFQSKYSLSFPLLCDRDGKFAKEMGAVKNNSILGFNRIKIARSTFLVGKDGELLHMWYNVKVEGHAKEVDAEINKYYI